jgi:hypothetical protein
VWCMATLSSEEFVEMVMLWRSSGCEFFSLGRLLVYGIQIAIETRVWLGKRLLS